MVEISADCNSKSLQRKNKMLGTPHDTVITGKNCSLDADAVTTMYWNLLEKLVQHTSIVASAGEFTGWLSNR